MQASGTKKITIAGAGLAGALLATLLARKGWQVEVFEKRPDPRVKGYEGGRSINLALAERGLHALREAGLNDAVMQQAVMMRGRMVHMKNDDTQLQRYGKDDSEVIWSVHRGELNITLLNAAEAAGAKISFNRRIENIDFDKKNIQLINDHDRSTSELDFEVLIGADGAGSGVRTALKNRNHLTERFESLGHSYKELEIPPSNNGEFRIEANALHIWPRGGYMCIALPNTEKTFTVTLFLPNEGDP
ncbi:MAG TPA: FAD-dependent monooxygenase, partial [Arenimonas sp.]|nr:FAD-dependent monooxygenase [Arenimonas sp.]